MNLYNKFLIDGSQKVNLKKYSPDSSDYGWDDEKKMLKIIQENGKKLFDLQYRLYAENKQSLLIVLQALDAAGKDGTINHVISVMNPQGCRSQSFKIPTPIENSHDFLWREHMVAPHCGEVVIFNRSHYEDVLVRRVHQMISKNDLKKHLDYINYFEEILNNNNTKIVKFFLHISKEEQLMRFGERLANPSKQWKISEGDYKERAYWDDYIKAFEAAINHCSTKDAPWFVIPSNNKTFRDLVVSEILLQTLEKMSPKLPAVSVDINYIKEKYHQDAKAEESQDEKMKKGSLDKVDKKALQKTEKIDEKIEGASDNDSDNADSEAGKKAKKKKKKHSK